MSPLVGRLVRFVRLRCPPGVWYLVFNIDAIERKAGDGLGAKDVAARYGFPVLDLYEEYSVDPENEEHRKLYYTEDGESDTEFVHPNSEGHQLMYPLWREFIIELMTGTTA